MSAPMIVAPRRFSFLLLPGFTLLSYVAAIEVLRQVNRLLGDATVSWEVLSLDGEPVQSSGGMPVVADRAMGDAGLCEWVCVCAGFLPARDASGRVLSFLNRQDRFGATVGSSCSGSYLLLRAGLLEDVPFTIHWEHAASLVEEFPDCTPTMDLYLIQGRRFTCAGGAAMFDMMLDMLANAFSPSLAEDVRAQLLIHDSREDQQALQRRRMFSQTPVLHPGLARAVELVEQNLEVPLTRTELAEACGLSIRHMERLFIRSFNTGPAGYYKRARLRKARYLLMHTTLKISEVSLSCGFASPSHFAKTYRAVYGISPTAARKARYYSGARGEGLSPHRAAVPGPAQSDPERPPLLSPGSA